MAWMQCRGCSAKFAVGLLRCPQCNKPSELFAVPEEVIEAEQEANMPKITVAAGASNALDPAEEPVADAVLETPVVAEPGPVVPQEEAPDGPEAPGGPEKGPKSEPAADEVPAEPVAGHEDAEPTAKEAAPAAPKKRAARKPPTDAGTRAGA